MIHIHALDDVWVQVECEDGIARELADYFTFETPGAAFMRRQARFKRWDGKIRLFKLKTHTLYRGLVPRLLEFAAQRDYPITSHVPAPTPVHPGKALDAFLEHSLALPFTPHDYQYAALRTTLDQQRGIILSPTGSGKSFIIYLLTQAMPVKKTLIVVPTIGLVSQMAKDFKNYGFDLSQLHTISAGAEKDADAELYISTWQSIYQLPPEYFKQFGCIIVDEVHGAKSKSLTHLLEQATHTPFRYGFTGTLDDTQCNRLILEGLFGEVTRVATTSELQKAKHLTPLHVRMVMLKYPEQAAKLNRKASYQDEIDYILSDAARLEFIARLAREVKGNALILFNYVEKHGLPLYGRIKLRCPNKTVHYIAGSVDGAEREDIREHVEFNGDNQVVVASFGTTSTGVNIPNLKHLIFASPSKSKIRVIQSVGRALRLSEGKTIATLWDLVDDLRIGKHVNFAMKHAEERAEYYATEKFPVRMMEFSLSAISLQTAPADTLAAPPRGLDV
jgi:superfamily II DNA or RNA helicase